MMVKVCGITNRDDAVAAAGEGASALGFNFCPGSPRCLLPETAAGIGCLLPPAVLKVGIFLDAAPERVLEVAALAALDVVQLHGSSTADGLPRGIRIWKACRAASFHPRLLAGFPAEAFLIDGGSGGQGVTFDWNIARGLPGKIILAGGLDGDNVGDAIRVARPWGVDACSRLETAPGRKDRAMMTRFIRAALAGDRA